MYKKGEIPVTGISHSHPSLTHYLHIKTCKPMHNAHLKAESALVILVATSDFITSLSLGTVV